MNHEVPGFLCCFRLMSARHSDWSCVSDTPSAIGFMFTWTWLVGFILLVSVVSDVVLMVFDTPGERWFFNGSLLVHALLVA